MKRSASLVQGDEHTCTMAIHSSTRAKPRRSLTAQLCLLGLLLAGCPRDVQPRDAQPPDAAWPLITVEDGRGLLFGFFDRRAELRTVERIEEVEAHARAQVQVTDPQRRPPGDLIYVADLSKRIPGKGYRTWVEQRGAWLMRHMPKLTMLAHLAADEPGPAAKKPAPRKRHRVRRRRPTAAKKPAAPRVVLYTTAWCPSCRTAKAFFQSKGVPFVEKDVEKDQAAAEEYAAVCQRAGLRRGAVPVIVVNGQAFQGFSAQQMEGALQGR